MSNRISILGCGWLGIPLAEYLIHKGYKVLGSTTSKQKLEQLSEKGIIPFLIDINTLGDNIRDFLTTDVLVIATTCKNIEAIQALINHVESSGVKKVIFISSTSVYSFNNDIITEDTPTNNNLLAQIENLFIENETFKTTILRFGGLFGYNRKPGNFIKPGRKVENPEGYINFIHQDDCIAIIESIISKNIWGDILNACSDSHPKRRDFYIHEFKKVDRDDLEFNENTKNEYKIVSSDKLKQLLNYEFKYDDLLNY